MAVVAAATSSAASAVETEHRSVTDNNRTASPAEGTALDTSDDRRRHPRPDAGAIGVRVVQQQTKTRRRKIPVRLVKKVGLPLAPAELTGTEAATTPSAGPVEVAGVGEPTTIDVGDTAAIDGGPLQTTLSPADVRQPDVAATGLDLEAPDTLDRSEPGPPRALERTFDRGRERNRAPAAATAAGTEPGPGGKRMQATRTNAAPVLDGLVDDDVWRLADPVSDFLQREPQEGQTPSERSEAYVLYDERNLYLGFVLYDSDPSGIIAAQLRRDSIGGRSRSDDMISVVLDTFHDHRNAFLFSVNPLGTKFDATIRGETQVNRNWDERWEAAARVTERGWEAELVIPLGILRYSGSSSLWGIDFQRMIRRKNEEVIWSNYRRNFEFRAVSQAGHLVGLEGLKLTERFRFKPYVTGGYDALNQRDLPLSEGRMEFGIEDFKIKINSNLTSQLTFNTDFAQVEVDEQRVNLTRFSLFFPEKREFFLEAANNFSFGPQREGRGGFGPPLARLYHSRNIGLDEDGNALPITYGAKLTGKIGKGNLGLLNVQTGDSISGSGQNYTALRWRQDVMGRSSIGAIFTNVQGSGGAFNRVMGLDANFNFFENLNITAFAATSRDRELEGGSWIGQFQARWDSDLWEASGDVMLVDHDFRSDLGFILRTDIVRQAYRSSFKPRPRISWLRQISFNAEYEYFTDTTGRPIESSKSGDIWLRLESGDNLFASYRQRFERLDLDFDIHSTVTIPAGDYHFNDFFVGFFSDQARPLSGRVFVNFGEFYDGSTVSLNPEIRIRFNQKFILRPSFRLNWVDLPGGSFTTNIASARADLSFSDRWLTDSLLQYNSLTEELSVFARLRYIYRIGDSFYLVYRQARRFDGTYSGLADRSMTAKMTYSFQW